MSIDMAQKNKNAVVNIFSCKTRNIFAQFLQRPPRSANIITACIMQRKMAQIVPLMWGGHYLLTIKYHKNYTNYEYLDACMRL